MPAAKKTAATKPADRAEIEAPEEPTAEAGESLTAVAHEATDIYTWVEHNGKKYSIPAAMEFPLEVILAENEIEALAIILGEEQWETYRKTRPTIRDFQEFSEKVNRASGN
ncbi:hypothetical protein [Streptomyces sp. NPDC047990]|uniref:hypothetical protein n=1 Tax=Streptomyces sp. NPDC047990 TaxID=3365496 RepID=UPI003714981F